MSAVLEIQSLNKSFGGIKATDDLNLSVEQGELHAIIGPNGAGKTTLISQLSGMQTPDSGAIRFQGRNITRLAAHKRAHLGITRSFQITSLIMQMTVLDNIALAVQAGEGHSFRFIRAARRIASLRDRAMALLERVGLADKADFPTVALSHGEHRHMEIAIALASNAELMLLDEPMAGLGTEESARMVDLLRGIKGQHSILLIEHDIGIVMAVSDHVIVMHQGQKIADGTPTEVRANPAVQAAYFGHG